MSLVKLKIHPAERKKKKNEQLSYHCDGDRFSCSDIDLVKHSAVASIFFFPFIGSKAQLGVGSGGGGGGGGGERG